MTKHPGVILALGGGSARGLAHIGVLRTLTEAGVPVKGIAGTSIGAIVGGLWAAGALDQYEIIMRGIDGQSVLWFLDPVLPTAGFFEGNRVDAMHKALLGDLQIEDLPLPYCAVAADLESGEEVRLRKGLLADAMRASLAIPGIFHPHRVDGRWLLDGGVVAPMPIAAARELGDLPLVAVNLQTRLFPHHEPTSRDTEHHPMGIPAPGTRERLRKLAENPALRPEVRVFLMETVRMGEAAGMRLARRTERLWRRFTARGHDHVPGLFTTVNEGFSMMQSRLAGLAARVLKPELVLEPQLPGVGMFDYGRAAEIIEEGARVTRAALHAGRLEKIGANYEGLRKRLGRLRRFWKAG